MLCVPMHSVNQNFQTSVAINTLLLGRCTLTINHAIKRLIITRERGMVICLVVSVCLCVFPACALTFESLDLETSLMLSRHTFKISTSTSHIKVTRSQQHSESYKCQ